VNKSINKSEKDLKMYGKNDTSSVHVDQKQSWHALSILLASKCVNNI
jgi:hypothetical protein